MARGWQGIGRGLVTEEAGVGRGLAGDWQGAGRGLAEGWQGPAEGWQGAGRGWQGVGRALAGLWQGAGRGLGQGLAGDWFPRAKIAGDYLPRAKIKKMHPGCSQMEQGPRFERQAHGLRHEAFKSREAREIIKLKSLAGANFTITFLSTAWRKTINHKVENSRDKKYTLRFLFFYSRIFNFTIGSFS